MCANSVPNSNKTSKPGGPSNVKDAGAKKVVATAALFLLSMYIVLNFLWIFRIGTLAHWSYLVGVSIYPENARYSMWLSASLFLFISIGSFIPQFLFPRLKNVALALSVPPQLHMLYLLNNLNQNLENYASSAKPITTIIKMYTVTTFASAMWTLYNIFMS